MSEREASERFAAELSQAEERLRAAGLGGRRAFVALIRHLAARLGLPRELWPEGPDAPATARLEDVTLASDIDLFGLAYERFFTDLFKGARGQYFTPRPLVELMADLAAVRPRDRVLDPTCGSGGFLAAALARGADVDGIEVDPDLVALARLNLALHGGNPRAIRQADFFADEADEAWDVILANPPFSVEIADPAILSGYTLGRDRARVVSDALFVEAALRRLRPGGRLVTLLPRSVLSSAQAAPVRVLAEDVAVREAVISLPEGVFLPFGGTPTRACIVALRKRPAQVRPVLMAVVRSPGFDPKRRRFRRTEPDELAALRLHLRGAPFARARRVDGASWVPEEALGESTVAVGVPTFRLEERARLQASRTGASPDAEYTVVDLADCDKTTGEVVSARVQPGAECEGVTFDEGDLLFGRMRPELNNVAVATRPRPGLPEKMAGSGEWVRFTPGPEPAFTLLAMRSSFARAQLTTTEGQTRPRVQATDIAGLELPDPGEAARAALDALLADAHAERLRLRRLLAEVDALYERFGRGEISARGLERAVRALGRRKGKGGRQVPLFG